MSYQPVSVENFGGLNLTDDPGAVGWNGAIDLLDVNLDYPGLLKERERFTSFINTSLTSPYLIRWPSFGTLACTAASIKLYDSSGALVGVSAVAPNQYYEGSAQAIGTAAANYCYLADPTGTNAIRRLTTAPVISAPAGMPRAKYLARSPSDNRLVAANIGGTSEHRVQFSDAGDPETWGANNYVDLDPGDGEVITGAVTWRDLLFVFKQSKFFVFYGNSTDSSGLPIFNYRAVRTGTGALVPSGAPTAITTGPDGVYFYGRGRRGSGVFRTTGQDPEYLSAPIEPLWKGTAPASFTPGNITPSGPIAFANGRLYLLASATYLWIYDPTSGRWTVDQLATSTSISLSASAFGDAALISVSGVNAVVHTKSPTSTSADSLRTPTPLYRSGFSDLGSTDEKRVPAWTVQGSGTPTLKLSTDFGSLETGASLTLGIAPAVAEARRRYAPRGRQFSWQFSGAGPWSVNNLVAHVADKKSPGDT